MKGQFSVYSNFDNTMDNIFGDCFTRISFYLFVLIVNFGLLTLHSNGCFETLFIPNSLFFWKNLNYLNQGFGSVTFYERYFLDMYPPENTLELFYMYLSAIPLIKDPRIREACC